MKQLTTNSMEDTMGHTIRLCLCLSLLQVTIIKAIPVIIMEDTMGHTIRLCLCLSLLQVTIIKALPVIIILLFLLDSNLYCLQE